MEDFPFSHQSVFIPISSPWFSPANSSHSTYILYPQVTRFVTLFNSNVQDSQDIVKCHHFCMHCVSFVSITLNCKLCSGLASNWEVVEINKYIKWSMYVLLVALCCGNQGSKKVPSGTSRFSCREVRFHSHLPNRALRQVVRHISKKIKLPKADKIWELLFQKPRGIFMRFFLALETLDLYGTLETNADFTSHYCTFESFHMFFRPIHHILQI